MSTRVVTKDKGECARREKQRVARDSPEWYPAPVSRTLEQIKVLVGMGEVRISNHGYDELAADGILLRDMVAGLLSAEVVEDYPDFPKGPCVLVLERDRDGGPIHAVWGIPKDERSPAVLVTAYRPSTDRWTADFRRRRK